MKKLSYSSDFLIMCKKMHHLLGSVEGYKLEHVVRVEEEIFSDEKSRRVEEYCCEVAANGKVFIDVVRIKSAEITIKFDIYIIYLSAIYRSVCYFFVIFLISVPLRRTTDSSMVHRS